MGDRGKERVKGKAVRSGKLEVGTGRERMGEKGGIYDDGGRGRERDFSSPSPS